MLTALEIRRRKQPTDRPVKLVDEKGLYLLLTPKGGRYWRFNYRFAGKYKTLALGTLDDVSLTDARAARDTARHLLREGRDPADERKLRKTTQRGELSFDALAKEWLGRQEFAATTRDRYHWIFGLLRPGLGAVPVTRVTLAQVVPALQTIEDKVSTNAARRAKQAISAVLRYGVLTSRADRDVTSDLRSRDVLKPPMTRHHPAILDPTRLGALLRAIDELDGSPIVRAAMQLAPLVFVRPGELRTATWADINLETALWRIPAARLKRTAELRARADDDHLVPLSRQAVAILRGVREWSGQSVWVFPAVRTYRRPMSDGTLNAALRRLGYGRDEMTTHGWRAVARTLLVEELGADPYVIEAQLAHATPGPLGAAYARAQYRTQRTTMMQAWADYLDNLKRGDGAGRAAAGGEAV